MQFLSQHMNVVGRFWLQYYYLILIMQQTISQEQVKIMK